MSQTSEDEKKTIALENLQQYLARPITNVNRLSSFYLEDCEESSSDEDEVTIFHVTVRSRKAGDLLCALTKSSPHIWIIHIRQRDTLLFARSRKDESEL